MWNKIEEALLEYAIRVPNTLGNKFTIQSVQFYLDIKFNQDINVLKVNFNARNISYNLSIGNKVYNFNIHI